MKKQFAFFAALMCGALSFSSCSDDDGGDTTGDRYSDRSYGQAAIDDCNTLDRSLQSANTLILSSFSNMSDAQKSFLSSVLENLVDNVIVPTYTQLADEVESLEEELHGLTVYTITQEDIDSACVHFLRARAYWELSEAFLMGAASDYDIDPTIDSWPLNRSLLLDYFNNGMSDAALDDASILGFHALEFILFRDGSPRTVSELHGYDTYKRFEDITGEQELAYAQTICTLLKERTFQLQVAWEGVTAANADRVSVVEAAGLDYTVNGTNGLSYGENLKQAGVSGSSSIYRNTLSSAISQVLSDDEGSAAAIAVEVGTQKIANPFSAGDISYVESPYSYNSITDFQDNIYSIRNVWLGSCDGSIAEYSFYNFFVETNNSSTATTVVNNIEAAYNSIGSMPAPFVKYVSTIWGIAFEDDETWESYD